MPLDKSLKKIMILGSGPIIIGQAAEFDYSGTQACKAIKEEGIETILINSNPATIMTDYHIADRVYIEPLTIDSVEKIIEKERPDGILAGFGGQTALNLASKLYYEGIIDKYNVKLLGVDFNVINKAEDREEFKKLMIEIGEPVPMSIISHSLDESLKFAEKCGYPLIIRPAFTLGGTGGGIASNKKELQDICDMGLKMSPIGQVLLEKSVAGWKEIELEVIRDKKDNCIIICSMENLDPVGVHTGDSIVIAPCQTLRDKEYQMLRAAAIKIIRSLGIQGGCNIQFALSPFNEDYYIIEVNPRVSRSSALASKAAGYPIAKIAAKIAIGYSLDELKNYVTKSSSACFEPVLDYVVVKIPKWPFDKFKGAERKLGTQMKATGEVMAISRDFESALIKAVTCLEGGLTGLRLKSFSKLNKDQLLNKILKCDDERIFAIAEAIRKGISIDLIHEKTKIDMWFLSGIENIVNVEKKLKKGENLETAVKEAEKMGFTDREICFFSGLKEDKLEELRKDNDMFPVYKMVDTCSGEFQSETPYFYSCYDCEDESPEDNDKKILVIGSGPIRIGQGIEFDYCSVHGVWAIREAGYKAVIINNNPETVSTDFDTSDKLYFESLYIDDVMNVIRKEKPEGVIVQFGGQTSLNLAYELNKRNVNIIGTDFNAIDLAEDRDKFRLLLEELEIPVPEGIAVTDIEEAKAAVEKIKYPVLVRPSYVIGGRAMEVIHDDESLLRYLKEAVSINKDHPVLIDKYVKGTEIEVDALCDGDNILIPGIMEHIERTGVHSGDSITVYPTITLNKNTIDTLKAYTEKISKKLNVKGLVNIQYVYDGHKVYVIEVNPRASRTVPILSKVTKVPMVKIAVDIMLGKKLIDMNFGIGLIDNRNLYAVKVPVFSNEKLSDVDTYLSPEMKSTGEVLGVDKELNIALYKGFKAAGYKIPVVGSMYISLKMQDKNEGESIVKMYQDLGFKIYASQGTGEDLTNSGIECTVLDYGKAHKLIKDGEIKLIINTPTKGNTKDRNGFRLRRKASEYRVPVFTSMDTAKVFLEAIKIQKEGTEINFRALSEYFQ